MGDGGSGGDPQHHAQNPHSRLGKLLRINVGASPARVTTYAKGLRNPWRFSFDRKTGALWIGDVGQNAWEEIDYLRPGRPAGANLGWNGYEGTHVYDAQVAATLNKASLTWPVAQYSHALGKAVTGGYVYRGSAIPALRGFYLFADFASGHVWAKKGPGGARRALSGADGQVSPDLVVRAGRERRAVRGVARRVRLQDRPALKPATGDGDGPRRRLSAGAPPGTSWCGDAAGRSPEAPRSHARRGRGSRRQRSRA